MKKICTIIIAICIVLLFNVYVYAADSFTLDEESINVKLNETTSIGYTGGTGTVTWESSDTSVATVDSGAVKGLKIGEATITATRGSEAKTCKVKVIYDSIDIGSNISSIAGQVNLVLNEHPTENLYTTIKDGKREIVKDAKVTWSSSDTSIVTVDKNTGTITAVKAGEAIITASAAGVTDTCKVIVSNGPVFTNFDNAKYELLFDTKVDLKITGIEPNKDNNYYYIITSNNTKPTISKTPYGTLNTEIVTEANKLAINTEKKHIFSNYLDKYVELNQDLYLWVIETVKLEKGYALDKENDSVSYSTKFVVEGQKLERPFIQLDHVIERFSITGNKKEGNVTGGSTIYFKYPTTVENRKFKLKIGKVTDNSILQKIKNNDYSGITELLSYAKNNDAIYTEDLQTTNLGRYSNFDKVLFDGFSLLQHKAYYYIYAEFDDENGKYYPVQGIRLVQGWNKDSAWMMLAPRDDKFEWTNLSSTPTDTGKKEDPEDTVGTKPTGKLPNAGSKTFIIIAITSLVTIAGVVCYKKYDWFRNVK